MAGVSKKLKVVIQCLVFKCLVSSSCGSISFILHNNKPIYKDTVTVFIPAISPQNMTIPIILYTATSEAEWKQKAKELQKNLSGQ